MFVMGVSSCLPDMEASGGVSLVLRSVGGAEAAWGVGEMFTVLQLGQ